MKTNAAQAVITCFEVARDQHRREVENIMLADPEKPNIDLMAKHAARVLAASRVIRSLTEYAKLLGEGV